MHITHPEPTSTATGHTPLRHHGRTGKLAANQQSEQVGAVKSWVRSSYYDTLLHVQLVSRIKRMNIGAFCMGGFLSFFFLCFFLCDVPKDSSWWLWRNNIGGGGCAEESSESTDPAVLIISLFFSFSFIHHLLFTIIFSSATLFLLAYRLGLCSRSIWRRQGFPVVRPLPVLSLQA